MKQQNSENHETQHARIERQTEDQTDNSISETHESHNGCKALVGIDMIRLCYQYNRNDLKYGPNTFAVQKELRKRKITMSHRAGYVFFRFNINSILKDKSPYSRDTSYYAAALLEVEDIIRNEFDDTFRLNYCFVSAVELHRTFHVNSKPFDYYSMLKEINQQAPRKKDYKENSENSGSIYWVTEGEKFVIYDKSDQLAYKEKHSKDVFSQMDKQMIRAEWRLKNKSIVKHKLGIATPLELLEKRENMDTLYNDAWGVILPNYAVKPRKKHKTSATAIEKEFYLQQDVDQRRYSETAIIHLYMVALINEGTTAEFFNARKGSYDCNKRLNKVAREFLLSVGENNTGSGINLYNELRAKVICS